MEPWYVRWTLISITVLFLTVIIVMPVAYVIHAAFSRGLASYWEAVSDIYTLLALKLSLIAAFFSVVFNLAFGLSIAWALGKFRIPGSRVLTTLIELPLSLSPVTAGLIFILYLGKYSWVGGWLDRHGIDIIYAVPGVVITTMFVTMPYIARELIPLMQEAGSEEEESALILGAGGLRTFFLVTLPKIKWGVIYGILITNARAIGEFGAVSVVSGHLRGKTDTLTLQVEILYNEYHFAKSFAVASLLAMLAIVTLLIKSWIDFRKAERI